MQQLQDEVQEVFRDVFDDDEIVVESSTTAEDVEGWDSLMHINLVIALERRFKVKFATSEIAYLKEDGNNVGTLMDLLTTKLS